MPHFCIKSVWWSHVGENKHIFVFSYRIFVMALWAPFMRDLTLIHLVNTIVNCKTSNAWDKKILNFLIIVNTRLILESWSHVGVGVYGINTRCIYLLVCMYLWRAWVPTIILCNIFWNVKFALKCPPSHLKWPFSIIVFT